MKLWGLIHLSLGVLATRQLFVLGAVLRSRRFLRPDKKSELVGSRTDVALNFYVVIPVLREAAQLSQTIDHFKTLTEGHHAKIIVVTTMREKAEAGEHADAPDTVVVAKQFAHDGKIVHLHYPYKHGIKGDQLNFALDFCLKCLLGEAPAHRAFFLIYDADSRPPLDSLSQFEEAIVTNPGVSVFHQSSRFELRATTIDSDVKGLPRLRRGIADSGALRANRFVLGYEIPRLLNRSKKISSWLSRIRSCVYAHVTGHGLCIRLSLLRELPFPARSPLEDMHYSFLLGSRNLLIVPIKSLDCAEVPESLSIQFEQLARWFYGPARFFRYLSDPATQSGWRARLMAASAAGITVEWLSCTNLPVMLVLLFIGERVTWILIVSLLVIYATQLVAVEQTMSGRPWNLDQALRILSYPVTFTMFGFAGVVGLCRLLRGDTGAGKTEHS